MTDPDPGNGDPKRSGDDSTGRKEWESGVDGKNHNVNSSAPKSLTEDYNSHQYSDTPRNGSGKNSDDGASGSSLYADHRQGIHWRTNHLARSISLTDRGSKDERENRWDFGGTDGKGQDNSSAPRSFTDKSSHEDSFTPGNESRRNPLGRPMNPAPPEIFTKVTAKLDKEWFTEALQEHMKAEMPSLSIKNESDFVEVIGKFEEIQLVHGYLQGKLEHKFSAEKPPDTSSDWSPTDSSADQVCVPSALYEYIMEIYRTEMDDLQRTNGVRIDHHSTPEGSTYVRFISQGSGSSPEKAKERFTDKVQKVTGDWSQETVNSSVVPLTISDIKERVKAWWSNTLVIQGENKDIVLRGPGDELSQVKTFLETTDHKPSDHKPSDYKTSDHKPSDHKPARPPRPVTISTSNMKTEIEVDARHMDILRKLKYRQISDIEKKYNVKMEENKKNVSSLVTFRSLNAPPDLSPHASHSFITLLQKTFFNIERKEISVKPEFTEERVSLVQKQLMMAGIDIVMEYSKGTLLLIGHPVHVALAEEKLNGNQNSGRGQAAAASEEKMDTSSSSAATKKEEEPDKCPICLCEMKDKVILEKCKHAYCKDCLKQLMAHKPVCAICGVSYGTVTGDQPDGTMNVNTRKYQHLPGYSGCGTIEIIYDIPSGIQKENHPRPGRSFSGARRTAYLPDNKEGNEILLLLKRAFDQRLIFTVGDSRTSGATDTVTWNDVHHKTSTSGGPQSFGYPDPDYLNRVRDELKAKGVE
ncbi:E3 ubiquitin-protein ligase DTX3L-like isoform X2 [Rana temporaria]|nr:E3 ubiquitin-protein ligase DTX3L-like isoform X2 [Rana temporaria]